jgi:short-subunit dehydrogenase
MTTPSGSTFTLITGASSGIGLELARRAAADGRDLILVARNERGLEGAARELRRSVAVHTIALDLSQPGAAQEIYQYVCARSLDVDCLINNAGFGDYGDFASSDLIKQERMIGVNVVAPTALNRLFLPAMVERGQGHIMNVASVTGFLPGPFMSTYFATKHYVLALSEALSEELRGSGVRVTALCPPPVNTQFARSAGVAPANYLATSDTGPAEVAGYGYRMMLRGKSVAVYRLRYKLLTSILVRLTPRFALRRLLHRLNTQGMMNVIGRRRHPHLSRALR